MLDPRELQILTHLRKDARTTMADIAKATETPISTVFEKLKKHNQTTIKKFTTILDFPKLGYNIRKKILVSALEPDEVIHFLNLHPNVNSLYKTNNGFNIVADCIFKEMNTWYDFKQKLYLHSITETKIIDITDEIKREEFLT
tara:strand:- start:6149 stop:6577 length:429 start_codon:yes stop_codon:yes gene_type:complete